MPLDKKIEFKRSLRYSTVGLQEDQEVFNCDLQVILDAWTDCQFDDNNICLPLSEDDRYDTNQLDIFKAVPFSLPYSEVTLLHEKYDKRIRGKSTSPSIASQTRIKPSLKLTVKGTPLKHIRPSTNRKSTKTKNTPPSPLANHPVIIIHDIFRSQTEWQPFSADLAAMVRRKVMVVDLRNHGTFPISTSLCGLPEFIADLKNLFKELKLTNDKVSLIGHGVGGWIVMIYALLYPNKVRNIIIIEANPTDNEYLAKEIAKLEASLDGFRLPSRDKSITNIKIRIAEYLKDSIMKQDFRAYLVENIVVPDVVGKPEKWQSRKTKLISSLKSFSKFPYFLKFKIYDKPVFFIASQQSKILKPADKPNILKLFPQAKFIFHEKPTRTPHIDMFDDLLDIIKEFLIDVA